MTIGFLGLGVMGKPMAKNLLKAGYDLFVYDVRKEAMKELCNLGAKPAESAQELAAKSSDAVFIMVRDDEQTEEVIIGNKGVIYGIEDAVIISMSTISPSFSKIIAKKVKDEKGITMLDAPVSGGSIGAEAGTLSIMVGGPKEVYHRTIPFLKAMGKNIFYCGDIGSGICVKLANQIIFAVTIGAVHEALTVIAPEGIDINLVLDVCNKGTAKNWAAENWKYIMEYFSDPAIGSLIRKDIGIALKNSEQLGSQMPFARLAYDFNYWFKK